MSTIKLASKHIYAEAKRLRNITSTVTLAEAERNLRRALPDCDCTLQPPLTPCCDPPLPEIVTMTVGQHTRTLRVVGCDCDGTLTLEPCDDVGAVGVEECPFEPGLALEVNR